MPFSSNHAELLRYHSALAALTNPSPVQSVVRDSLGHILQYLQVFDTHIDAESPFVKEFMQMSRAVDTSSDACFSALECLALFFREKFLRSKQSPAAAEASLLHHFEESGKWDALDGTLVSQWYWQLLPTRSAPGLQVNVNTV